MAFGIGGPGGPGIGGGPGGFGGPGGIGGGFHGGPGGFGGFGHGHGGPGFGTPGFGPGGFGGFFGLGHFGPSISFSASGNQSSGADTTPVLDDNFPANIMTDRPATVPPKQPLTAPERVETFLLNLNAIKRAKRWLYALTVLGGLIVALSGILFSHVEWHWIFLTSSSILPLALSYTLRNLINECYDRPTANCFCFLVSGLSLLGILGGHPRLTIASALGYLAGGLVSNWAYQIACRAQCFQGFENNAKTFRTRCRGASLTGYCIEALVFAPLALIGAFDGFHIIWIIVCNFGLAYATECALSPLTCLCRSQFSFQLSAKNDYIDDPHHRSLPS